MPIARKCLLLLSPNYLQNGVFSLYCDLSQLWNSLVVELWNNNLCCWWFWFRVSLSYLVLTCQISHLRSRLRQLSHLSVSYYLRHLSQVLLHLLLPLVLLLHLLLPLVLLLHLLLPLVLLLHLLLPLVLLLHLLLHLLLPLVLLLHLLLHLLLPLVLLRQ